MAEMITDTRIEIRLCPLNIDQMSDSELDQWLTTNRGLRVNTPIRLKSSNTSTLKIPKEKKPPKQPKQHLVDASDMF